MVWTGMMGSYGYGWGMSSLWMLVGVALCSFIFSVVFWLCYNWLVVEKSKGKKK
ncbi:hypothetical protein J4437_01820 [Candidatus Woesearchaeota archaeon]|nr:hypothetical protein [Candidatus Woesearchaeota archaeon]